MKILESIKNMIGKHLFTLVEEDTLPPLIALSTGDSVGDYDLAMFSLRCQQNII